ncbi:MAG: glycoside hydrolase family 43 protein [Muribaculaceae bacterium]|nr:glycoside hydrolase family 43 protein [Muribaculaceae bacterium]MDY3933722.1 glycoside hydrolase family 43 protein [Muribaculaceae bacterium]
MKTRQLLATMLLGALLCLNSCGNATKASTDTATDSAEFVIANPLPIKFGDPYVLHASDGKFYMYGTSLSDGFEAYVSDDMQNWTSCGQVYKGAGDDQWNVDCFWAPEVYERNGKFYLFFSANSKDNPTHEGENFKLGVAVADSPTGPFADLYNRPIFNPPYPVIDANVLFDDENGKTYLYFSRCCYKHPVESEIAAKAKAEGTFDFVEESWVYGVEMKPDFSDVIGEPVLLLAPPTKLDDVQAEWESRSVTAKEVNRRWTEGSFIFKNNDTYYIMYSANHYGGAYYAVGYATSKDPLGPFKKAENNPVLQENLSQGGTVMGTGHNMVLTMPSGQRYCVYHGRLSDNPTERVVFVDPLKIDSEGVLTVEGPTVAEKLSADSTEVEPVAPVEQ